MGTRRCGVAVASVLGLAVMSFAPTVSGQAFAPSSGSHVWYGGEVDGEHTYSVFNGQFFVIGQAPAFIDGDPELPLERIVPHMPFEDEILGRIVQPADPVGSDGSSHREAPFVAEHPRVDGTDVYAFVSSSDANKIVVLSNGVPLVDPGDGPSPGFFDDDIRYEIHIPNNTDSIFDERFRFGFTILNDEFDALVVQSPGGAVETVGLPPGDYGGFRAFTGKRDDAFWIEMQAFDLLNRRTTGVRHAVGALGDVIPDTLYNVAVGTGGSDTLIPKVAPVRRSDGSLGHLFVETDGVGSYNVFEGDAAGTNTPVFAFGTTVLDPSKVNVHAQMENATPSEPTITTNPATYGAVGDSDFGFFFNLDGTDGPFASDPAFAGTYGRGPQGSSILVPPNESRRAVLGSLDDDAFFGATMSLTPGSSTAYDGVLFGDTATQDVFLVGTGAGRFTGRAAGNFAAFTSIIVSGGSGPVVLHGEAHARTFRGLAGLSIENPAGVDVDVSQFFAFARNLSGEPGVLGAHVAVDREGLNPTMLDIALDVIAETGPPTALAEGSEPIKTAGANASLDLSGFGDLKPFVDALAKEVFAETRGYQATVQSPHGLRSDFGDLEPFVDQLGGDGLAVTENTAVVAMAVSSGAVVATYVPTPQQVGSLVEFAGVPDGAVNAVQFKFFALPGEVVHVGFDLDGVGDVFIGFDPATTVDDGNGNGTLSDIAVMVTDFFGVVQNGTMADLFELSINGDNSFAIEISTGVYTVSSLDTGGVFAVVPEPGVLGLVCVGMFGVLMRRRVGVSC